MAFPVAFYEPEILADAAAHLEPGAWPELRLVFLLPAELLADALEKAPEHVREHVVLDPPGTVIASGELRAFLTTDVGATSALFPGVRFSDILTWPELGRLHHAEPPRFYGQFDPPVDKVLYDTYFRDVRGGFFIESGASDGVEENCCKVFEEFLGWRGINVEPSPVNFELLCAARPDAINVRAALSDHDGSATFTNALHPERGARFGNGSLSHTEAHIQELLGDGCTFETFDVETLRYDTLLARHGVDHVDLFVLDVEGHELTVLEGMATTRVWPRVFCVEYGNIGLEGLRSRLEPHGYALDFTAFNNAYFSRAA